MFAMARAGLYASILCLLAACGGGGSGGGSTTPPPSGNNPPPAPTAEDTANANASQLKMELRADTRELTITWTDTFSNETTYTIEARAEGGTWQTLDTLAPSTGTGNSYQWQRVIDSSRTYRVSATKTGYAVPLATPQGQTEIAVDLPTGPMTLEFSHAMPLQGTVELYLANALNVHSVVYYLDLRELDSPNTGPEWRSTWDTLNVADGEHALMAVVRLVSGTVVELRRTVVIANPGIRASLSIFPRGELGGAGLLLSASAVSDVGIQQVEFFINGVSVHVAPGQAHYEYRYSRGSVSDLPTGRNVFRIVATDNNGRIAEASEERMVNHPPTLTLTSPLDGQIVRDTLRIEGTFADDGGHGTVVARIQSLTILDAPVAGAFSDEFSLAGLPPGEYQFSLAVTDSGGRTAVTNRVFIIANGDETFELVAREVTELLATDQGAVLYRKKDGSYVVRSAAGVETTLQVPAGIVTSWRGSLRNGYAVLEGRPPTGLSGHIYLFAPNGEATNVSAPVHGADSSNSQAILKDSWVAWHNSNGQYGLHNVSTGHSRTIGTPAGALYVTSDIDLITTPGAEKLVFVARTRDVLNGGHDVFSYDIQSQTTQQLTGGDDNYLNPRTDNTSVAWLRGSTANQYTLLTAPVSTPSATTPVVSPVSDYIFRDGMFAWTVDRHLRATDGTTTRDLSEFVSVVHSVGDGRVLFTENGRLMLSPATGGKQSLLYSAAAARHDDDIAFVKTGGITGSSLLYRVQLR